MIPGMDPRSMARMMQQMGIKNDEVPATRVIIEQAGGQIIIDSPSVTKITMQGQSSFQISGKVSEQAAIRADDIQLVAGQTGASGADAKKALEECAGDIAGAILKLKKE